MDQWDHKRFKELWRNKLNSGKGLRPIWRLFSEGHGPLRDVSPKIIMIEEHSTDWIKINQCVFLRGSKSIEPNEECDE